MPDTRTEREEEVGGQDPPTSSVGEELTAAREAFRLEPDEVAVYLLERWRDG